MSARSLATGMVSALLAVFPHAAAAQSWNTPEVRSLAERAIARRTSVQADSGLRSFRARAHGFVFFLGQLGEGFNEPPQLVKSDQLALEVYWRAPGLSKQIIIGRRDRRDLPTDVQYHRDHLGIVQNNFGDHIRLGDGDEVRDVPHPLSPGGPDLYDYALDDSLAIELPDRTVRVYQMLVRPKDFKNPRVVGALFIDVGTAELVRFRFSFTPAAYLDNTLEDITVVLDNGLWFGRYWLPRRQEIEIRRRTSWLDLPARGIIRGRWEIGSYEFNIDPPPTIFAVGEPEIVYAPKAVRDSFAWDGALDAAIDTALGPVRRADLDQVRTELTQAAANRALTGLPQIQTGFGSVSDILHVNRVEGLATGFGVVRRFGGRKVELRAGASFGWSDSQIKFHGALEGPVGPATVEVRGGRQIRDVGDEPVISRLVNSFLSQEMGYDFGDYMVLDEVSLRARTGRPGNAISVSLGLERATSAAVAARPASGAYRPNPPLGGPTFALVRLEAYRRVSDASLVLQAEGGVTENGRGYMRFRGSGEVTSTRGPVEAVLSGWAGWGSRDLPHHRPFVMGGRGSLPGEPFRAWGGRHAALGRIDLRKTIPFLPLPLGAFGSTGPRALGGLFVAGGWTGGAIAGAPWIPSQHPRVVAGATLEMFHRLLRAELGVGLRDGRVGFSVDVRKDLWSIL